MPQEHSVAPTARSADRAMRILVLLGRRQYGVPTSTIIRECAIPKSSAHVLLNTMQARSFVRYDAERHLWELGDKARALGASAPTIDVALAILESFDRQVLQQTAVDIVRGTALDPAEVRVALGALEREALVQRYGDGSYSLGLRVARIAARLEPIARLRSVALPMLIELRDATGETANLLIRDGDNIVFLEQAESYRALRHSGWAGRQVPMRGTAAGAALSGVPGVHESVDAVEVGISAIACRVPWHGQQPVAVGITGPTLRFTSATVESMKREVEKTARRIGAALEAR